MQGKPVRESLACLVGERSPSLRRTRGQSCPRSLVAMFTSALTLVSVLLLSPPAVRSQGVRNPITTWNNRFQEVWGAESNNNVNLVRPNNFQNRFQQQPNNLQNGYQNVYQYNFSTSGTPNDINLEDIIRQQLAQEGIKVDNLETVKGNSFQIGNGVSGNFGNVGNLGNRGQMGNNGGFNNNVAANGYRNPNFEFLNPAGVRITIPGPYDQSDQPYQLSFHVNVNQDLGSSRRGQYNGEVVIPNGSSWTFTVPDVRVNYFDTIYYLVEVRGQLGRRTWKRENRGYYQVPVRNPHGAGAAIDNRVQPNTPVLVNPPPQITNSNPAYNQPLPVNPVGWSDSAQPSILYLDGSGIRVNLPGPYEQSNVYLLKYRVDVNREVNGLNDGLYKGEVTIPKGNEWSFTVPDIRVRRNDRVYYWVEVSGQDGSSIWSRNFRGYNYVNDNDPHGPEYIPPQVPSNTGTRPKPNFTTYPPITSGNATPSVFTRPPTVLTTKPQTPPIIYPTTTTQAPPIYFQPSERTTPLPTTTTRKPSQCQPSSTTYNNGKRPCIGVPVIDQFNFNSIEQIGGTNPEDSFTVFLKDSVVQRNGLKYPSIVPSLLEDKYGAYFVDQRLTLRRCTSKISSLCSKQATGYIILPPIISGRQTTENSFSFRYGQLDITAKLPSGDWIVPELWLLPKNRQYGANSGKIVLAMSRGNRRLFDGVQDHDGRTLEVGVHIGDNVQMFKTSQDRMWADDYHTFQLTWSPDGMVFSVDNKEVGSITPGATGLSPSLSGKSKMAPFDQEFYLVYGVHVGGDKDFQDTLIGKPWTNGDPKDKLNFWQNRTIWHPSWPKDTELSIYDIRLTSLSY